MCRRRGVAQGIHLRYTIYIHIPRLLDDTKTYYSEGFCHILYFAETYERGLIEAKEEKKTAAARAIPFYLYVWQSI